ncbi:MAG: Holliday junction resolvase RuvX [Mycoplasma sp.]|nr:Holliday junction resolvase RuvX [Mycoplasma sp.]
MRILGIDFGVKNIGVAITDANNKIASAWLTITYPKNNYLFAINKLKKEIADYNVEKIVLGYPLNINGTISNTTKEVLKFKKLLEDNLNLEVILFDERYSTYKTTEMLKEQIKLKSSQIKRIKDKLSAQYILQEYIDHEINR